MIYKARNKATGGKPLGKTVLLCEACAHDVPEDEYVYAEWHEGPPEPVAFDDVYYSGDFSCHLDGTLPCNSCGKDLHDETNEAV